MIYAETYAIIRAMRATGNQDGIIACWKNLVELWAANEVNNPDAVSARAWLPMWEVRPFYTAAELAPIWPALSIALGLTKRWPSVLKSPARLAAELDYYGLPHFEADGQKYYIVEQIHRWQKATDGERQDALAAM